MEPSKQSVQPTIFGVEPERKTKAKPKAKAKAKPKAKPKTKKPEKMHLFSNAKIVENTT